MARKWKAVIIGAGGSQAQAMLRALARGGATQDCLALDRAWRPEAQTAAQSMGFATQQMDALADSAQLDTLLSQTDLVVNMAGPYYRTGTAILDRAIANGTNYLDISDDADVTIPMLTRNGAAEAAGVSALIGMGSSPGTTNILIRAAVDRLGPVEDVDIYWTVDLADMTNAAVRHFWHCFNLVDPDGTTHDVAGWDALEFREMDFPAPVGLQRLVRLAHPEPITVPQYLPVKRASNFGGLNPEEALVTGWCLAHIADERRTKGALTDAAVDLFLHYRDQRAAAPRIGSGLIIDVHTKGNGLRFASGSDGGMDDSTGIPAAVGVILMMQDRISQRGVFPPEIVSPKDFFSILRDVSLGGGGLTLSSLKDGQAGERLRIRDLLV
ncbi:saccharopine dehydrogenase [Mesorhizobium sp. Root102]|uniref:saccharopine dehydrogenase family protein n=1 Tax=Mesorhizobium sp. Root102 TaxID=1736422 RepID=UPI0006F3BE00|nr:saccharopine dehydrogenase NADP-binding domain-containing protein [Mesorhizobium sp. Root102]KQU85605.1 saccharopine dehydrogenase [Mesorhizobium sp. Root102]